MIWPPEPIPCDAKLRPDGFERPYSISSFMLWTGDDAGTISTLGNSTSGVIGSIVLDRVEAHVGLDRRRDREQTVVGEQQSGAVRGGLLGCDSCHHAATAAAVVDHHGGS